MRTENTLIGLYGIKKKFKVLGFYMDERNQFKAQLVDAIQQGTDNNAEIVA